MKITPSSRRSPFAPRPRRFSVREQVARLGLALLLFGLALVALGLAGPASVPPREVADAGLAFGVCGAVLFVAFDPVGRRR